MQWTRNVSVLFIAIWFVMVGLSNGYAARKVLGRKLSVFVSKDSPIYSDTVQALLSESKNNFVQQSLNRRLTAHFRSMGLSQLKDVARQISSNMNHPSQRPVFDHITITAALYSCQRHGLNHEAYQLFCEMQKSYVTVDRVTMMAVIRAVMKMGEIETILNCLDYCMKHVNDAIAECLGVAVETSVYASLPRGHAAKLLGAVKDWAQANGVWNSRNVLEQYTIAVCKLEITDEITRLPELCEVSEESYQGSSRSFSAVLARFSALNDTDTVERVVGLMDAKGIKKDTVILNILLQFYSKMRTARGLMKVLKLMVESESVPNEVSFVILRDLHSFPWEDADVEDWRRIATSLNVSRSCQNAFTICQDITNSRSIAIASSLFAEAETKNILDAAIVVAMAEKLVSLEQSYEQAFLLLETFMKRNAAGGNNLLRAMTKLVVGKFLVDRSAVAKERLWSFFDNHRRAFVCDTSTANNVLELVSSMGDGEFLLRLRRTFLARFCLPRPAVGNLTCCMAHNPSSISLLTRYSEDKALLNEVLLYGEFVAEQMRERPGRWQGWSMPLLETLVKYVGTVGGAEDCRRLLAAVESCPISPSGRIIHDFTKFFRKFGDIDGSAAVLNWIGSNKNHLSPVSIVNAIVAHLYDAGDKHRALAHFQQYATVHRIDSPWFVDPIDNILTLDLHYTSRGGAYVLLMTYLSEALSYATGQDVVRIITGKSLSSSIGRVSATKRDQTPYRLSDEVQNILIEEFFPPIPSSTEPGNPGRILLRLADINRGSLGLQDTPAIPPRQRHTVL